MHAAPPLADASGDAMSDAIPRLLLIRECLYSTPTGVSNIEIQPAVQSTELDPIRLTTFRCLRLRIGGLSDCISLHVGLLPYDLRFLRESVRSNFQTLARVAARLLRSIVESGRLGVQLICLPVRLVFNRSALLLGLAAQLVAVLLFGAPLTCGRERDDAKSGQPAH
jgi:hypothetical protein